MENQRKVVLYIAQSLDGYIARENDDISWLSIVDRDYEDYGYDEFIKTIDTVFMGRKTYEKVLTLGVEFPHKDKTCYVLSKKLLGADENVQFFNGSIVDLITEIKAQQGKDIFLDGGSELVRLFRDNNLIDEYVISIIPILLGKGIRLFRETESENNLRLVKSETFESGLVKLKYERVNY
jgi:dihydrofolate reductase